MRPGDDHARALLEVQREVARACQHLGSLDPARTAVEEVRSIRGDLNTDGARQYLSRFRFYGDDPLRKVSGYSGGERARLSLAKLLLEPRNLLFLDEPTNHLDIPAAEILEEDPQQLPVVADRYQPFEHVNVQVALEAWLQERDRPHELVGLLGDQHAFMSLADLVRNAHRRGIGDGVRRPEPGAVDPDIPLRYVVNHEVHDRSHTGRDIVVAPGLRHPFHHRIQPAEEPAVRQRSL